MIPTRADIIALIDVFDEASAVMEHAGPTDWPVAVEAYRASYKALLDAFDTLMAGGPPPAWLALSDAPAGTMLVYRVPPQ